MKHCKWINEDTKIYDITKRVNMLKWVEHAYTSDDAKLMKETGKKLT